MPEDPLDGWKALQHAGKGDGTLEVPSRTSGIETGFGPARYALGPQGERRLLILCSGGSRRRDLGATPKLQVSVTRYLVRGTPFPSIDIMCGDRSLDAVFAELTREILVRLSSGAAPEDATAGTISDFRELLLSEGGGEASRAAIIGLLGELHVLKELCRRNADAISAWTGPFELRHDFRRMVLALEVKTSGRSDATRVTINGAEQLMPPSGGRLALIHIQVEQADTGELRVESAFEELVAAGADRSALLKGLAELGCADPRDAAWNRLAFSVQGVDVYRVEEGFPRIVPASFPGDVFPEGISKLHYEIDLGHATRFRMTEVDVQQCLAEFVA